MTGSSSNTSVLLYNNIMEEIKCIRCGNLHRVKSYQVRNGTAKYCSRECHYDTQTIICQRCGKPKKMKKYQVLHGGKYCSRGCKQGPQIEYNCIVCGKPSKIRPSHFGVRGGGTYCSRKCKFLSYSNTYIEKKMRSLLDDIGLRYEEQVEVRIAGKRFFIFDFVIRDRDMIIECDGDYWHSRPRVKEIDKRKNNWCERNGWKLLRFTETMIDNNIRYCRDKILQIV